MIIKAKYVSRCELCGEQIEVGSNIFWEKGAQAVHAECHADAKTNEASPIKPVQPGTVARFKKPPAPVETYRRFECKTCEDHPQFDAMAPLKEHLKTVHQVDPKVCAEKKRLMHADARDFYVDKFLWIFANGTEVYEESKQARRAS